MPKYRTLRVIRAVVERGQGSPAQMDALHRRAGKRKLPAAFPSSPSFSVEGAFLQLTRSQTAEVCVAGDVADLNICAANVLETALIGH
jgi:hypothetical protein